MSDVQGVSGRALADLLGVSEAAVRKAERLGRIAKLPSGLYDPEACKAAWKARTDPTQQRKKPDAPAAAPGPKPVAPRPAQPTGDNKVVAFPGSKAGKPGRKGKARKPASDADGSEDAIGGEGEDIPGLVAELYREKIRKLRGENDLTERKQLDGTLTLLCVETWAREVRDAWKQLADKFCPEIAASMGLQDRQVELYAALSRAIDRHAEKTLDRIDPMKTLQRVLECL